MLAIIKPLGFLFTFLFSTHVFGSTFLTIDVKGSINPGSASFILESIKEAEETQSIGLILRLNTPGGLLSSTRDIIQGISESKVPVIVFVAPGGSSATSAGALIALSAHLAVMAPGTNIGAAHPVGAGGSEVKGPMGEKVTNDTAALARSQASLRGRNGDAAEKIVTKSQSFSADEALKNGIINFVAIDMDTLLQQIHGSEITVSGATQKIHLSSKNLRETDLQSRNMNLKQRFLHLIADPNISALLIALGGVALYAEISSGFSLVIPGVFGLFCLLLGFVSLQTLPISVGGALLFVLGFCLLIAEAFITSYGLLTVGAMVSIFIGGLFLIDPSAASMRVSLSILLPLVGSIGSLGLIVLYLFFTERRGSAKKIENSLVGKMAKVSSLEGNQKSGFAHVEGEIWAFESDLPMALGEDAPVKSQKGLKIFITRRT